jgi:hypothetical protein
MAAKSSSQIPVLTDIITRQEADAAGPARDAGAEPLAGGQVHGLDEALIAELQTELAAGAYELTESIMRSAFAEMEARIYADISRRLRVELPELIDDLLRERQRRESED